LGVAAALVAISSTTTAPQWDLLSTSCMCPSVSCGNGSTALMCQVTCQGQALCLCAYCIAKSGSSYVSGQNSCVCQ
jgi:hypothetical protein